MHQAVSNRLLMDIQISLCACAFRMHIETRHCHSRRFVIALFRTIYCHYRAISLISTGGTRSRASVLSRSRRSATLPYAQHFQRPFCPGRAGARPSRSSTSLHFSTAISTTAPRRRAGGTQFTFSIYDFSICDCIWGLSHLRICSGASSELFFISCRALFRIELFKSEQEEYGIMSA